MKVATILFGYYIVGSIHAHYPNSGSPTFNTTLKHEAKVVTEVAWAMNI